MLNIDQLGWFALHLYRGKKITPKFKDTELVFQLKLATGFANLRMPVGSGGPSQQPHYKVLIWFIKLFLAKQTLPRSAGTDVIIGSFEFINTNIRYL